MSRGLQGYTLLEPIGVVGHIIPCNFPAQMFSLKVAPALATGCTMVVKPAKQTNLAGVPDGVLNIVTGFGRTAGAAISSHMGIDKVSFTGSTEVGRLIMQAAAASNLKPVSLELGGKSPFIVFDDVDVDQIAGLALAAQLPHLCRRGFMINLWRKWWRKQKPKWLETLLIQINVQQGPQVSKAHYEREGATLLAGGKPLDRKGYFIEPTIFADRCHGEILPMISTSRSLILLSN
nr:aldehyde dehydrogenase family 2 member C4-like [Ipomoea batatas]